MSDWKYEINDGLVAFYENGIERNIDKVFDTLNAAEARIAELEAEIERLTVHSDTERQDDNYSNHTQTQTVVYRKESEG